MSPPRKRVCVIGAGASGIAALHELSRFNEQLDLVCYETREQAGGAWLYDEDPGESELTFDAHARPVLRSVGESECGFHPTPMYDGLRTNIPAAVMSWRRFSFETPSTESFPTREVVLDYIQARAFQVGACIRYSTKVLRVYKDADRWQVIICETRQTATAQESFDYLVVANGHYAQPYVPSLPGLSLWPSEHLMHSRWYRNAQLLKEKRVLVVGASASGSDIARQLAQTYLPDESGDAFVYFSIRKQVKNGIDPRDPDAPTFAKRIRVVPGLDRIEADRRIICGDQVLEDVDLIVFATGYLFHYPFFQPEDEPWKTAPLTRPPPMDKGPLTDGCRLSKEQLGGLRVHHLDAATSLFYRPDPSLTLPCLAYRIVPFPFAEAQARVIAKVWTGTDIDLDKLPQPPFKAVAASIAEEDETKLAHEYSAPHEFDYADRILHLVGEGTGAEVRDDGGLGAIAGWRRDLRTEIGKLRRDALGY